MKKLTSTLIALFALSAVSVAHAEEMAAPAAHEGASMEKTTETKSMEKTGSMEKPAKSAKKSKKAKNKKKMAAEEDKKAE